MDFDVKQYDLKRDTAIVYLCAMRLFRAIPTFLFCVLCLNSTVFAGTLAQFITPVGTILVELFDQDKPVTVANFIRLTEAGAYQNSFLHRAVPNFVIQGGGYRLISGTPYAVPHFGPITNEYAVGPQYSNVFGTIAMAKVGNDPDSATSQWFFNLADNSSILDHQNGGFTVFGRIIKGLEVLSFFNETNNYAITNKGAPFAELPLQHSSALFATQLYILRTYIEPLSDESRRVQWITAAGVTNILERSLSLSSPDWQPVTTFRPEQAYVATCTDTLAAASAFYRIRVE